MTVCLLHTVTSCPISGFKPISAIFLMSAIDSDLLHLLIHRTVCIFPWSIPILFVTIHHTSGTEGIVIQNDGMCNANFLY